MNNNYFNLTRGQKGLNTYFYDSRDGSLRDGVGDGWTSQIENKRKRVKQNDVMKIELQNSIVAWYINNIKVYEVALHHNRVFGLKNDCYFFIQFYQQYMGDRQKHVEVTFEVDIF